MNLMKLTLSLLMLMYVCIPKLHAADKKAGPSNEFFAFDNGVGIKNWSVEKTGDGSQETGLRRYWFALFRQPA